MVSVASLSVAGVPKSADTWRLSSVIPELRSARSSSDLIKPGNCFGLPQPTAMSLFVLFAKLHSGAGCDRALKSAISKYPYFTATISRRVNRKA